MEAELALDRIADDADVLADDGLLELGDVPAGGGAPEVAALGAAARVGGALGGDRGEVAAGGEVGDDGVGLLGRRHEDVADAHLGELGLVLLEVVLDGALVDAGLAGEVALEDQHPGVPRRRGRRGRPRGSLEDGLAVAGLGEVVETPYDLVLGGGLALLVDLEAPSGHLVQDDRVLDLASEDVGGERRREVALTFAEHVDAPPLERFEVVAVGGDRLELVDDVLLGDLGAVDDGGRGGLVVAARTEEEEAGSERAGNTEAGRGLHRGGEVRRGSLAAGHRGGLIL